VHFVDHRRSNEMSGTRQVIASRVAALNRSFDMGTNAQMEGNTRNARHHQYRHKKLERIQAADSPSRSVERRKHGDYRQHCQCIGWPATKCTLVGLNSQVLSRLERYGSQGGL